MPGHLHGWVRLFKLVELLGDLDFRTGGEGFGGWLLQSGLTRAVWRLDSLTEPTGPTLHGLRELTLGFDFGLARLISQIQ